MLRRSFIHRAALLPLIGAASPGYATELQPATLDAFEQYVRDCEARLESDVRGPASGFLWCAAAPARFEKVRAGEVVTESRTGKEARAVPDGLIHDWTGAVLIPRTSLERVLALVQDYDHHKDVYRPEVIDSRLLSHEGQDYRVYLRLLKKKVLTVVLHTEHDVRYFPLQTGLCYSRSRSTRINEIQDAGKPGEHELPPGKDHGFLWCLNSYWRFAQKEEGVYVECRAVSLTRDIPTGLGWMISPIIRNLPRESLENTLRATRSGVAALH